MAIRLEKHNEVAYDKTKEKFKESKKVAVIHPTGTGKMYIALKWIEDDKEKKALYVAPSNTILHDVKKSIFAEGMTMVDFQNLKRITYQKLMRLSDEELANLKVDRIILDEFHHCGAPEWGKGVERLLANNPNAEVLGLSATPLRYFDGLRDMSDEIFDNNVASEMSLEEAIERGILPEATYVSALYGYGAELDNMQANISKMKEDQRKVEAQMLLDKLRKKLDKNTQNLPELLAEHMTNKNGKYIVFCKDINDMQEKMKEAQKMFGSVNSNIKVRGVSSKIKKTDKILTEFENDNDENSLKLLFAVDMLNEGYHVKGLDGVVMMRPTFSPTIFTQQLGRALSVGVDKKPVVIDLVNNFDMCRIIEDFSQKMKQYRGRESKDKKKGSTKSRISIFDTTKEFRDIANKITELSKRDKVTLDEKILIFQEFFKTGEELAGNTVFEGYPIGQWAIQTRSAVKQFNEGTATKFKIHPTEEQLEQLAKLGILDRKIDSTIDEKIDMLIEWVERYPNARFSKKLSEEKIMEYGPEFKEEYERMQRYYVYLKQRNGKGRLTKEQFLKCREGNLGGIFGYSSQMEELSEKSGQSIETLESIIRKYESFDNFKSLYLDGKLKNNLDLKLAKKMFRKVVDIDMNSKSENYDKLFNAVFSGFEWDNRFVLYSSKKLEEALDTLTDREKYILKRKYELLDEELPSDVGSISKELNITGSRVRQIEDKVLKKLRHPYCYKLFLVRNFDDYKYFTDEEKRLITQLQNNIYSSDIVYKNVPYEMIKEDEKNSDILSAIEFIKNSDQILEIRKKEAETEKERKYFMDLEDTNIPEEICEYFKGRDIRRVSDLVEKLNKKDMYFILKTLGKDGYIEFFTKGLSEYYDGIKTEYFDDLKPLSQEEIEENLLAEIKEIEKNEFLDSKVEELELPTKILYCIKRRKLNRIRDVAELSRKNLGKIKGIGEEAIQKIEEKLESFGLKLGEVAEDPRKTEILNSNIEDLNLSYRAWNCLQRQGIETVKDLTMLSIEKLKCIKNLGKKSFDDIQDRLLMLGIELKSEEDDDFEMYEEDDEEFELYEKSSEKIEIPSKAVGLESLGLKSEENAEEKNTEKVLDYYIEELNLSYRVWHSLISKGIRTVRDVVEFPTEELKCIRNFGAKSFEEVQEKLADLGIDLDGNDLEEVKKEKEFIEKIVRYAEKRTRLSKKDKAADELEQQYAEQLSEEAPSVDED